MNRNRLTPITAEEVLRTELQMKLLYLLRDLGIKSANPALQIAFRMHMDLIAELSVGG